MTEEARSGGAAEELLSDSATDLSWFAGRVAIATLVVAGILVAAVLLWEARIVVALLLSAIILAAALRPGVDWLASHRVPPGIAVVIHYSRSSVS